MESTLFTALSTNEEANLSGGARANGGRGGNGRGGNGGAGGAGGNSDTNGGVVFGDDNAVVLSNVNGGVTRGGNGGAGGTGGTGGTGTGGRGGNGGLAIL